MVGERWWKEGGEVHRIVDIETEQKPAYLTVSALSLALSPCYRAHSLDIVARNATDVGVLKKQKKKKKG